MFLSDVWRRETYLSWVIYSSIFIYKEENLGVSGEGGVTYYVCFVGEGGCILFSAWSL